MQYRLRIFGQPPLKPNEFFTEEIIYEQQTVSGELLKGKITKPILPINERMEIDKPFCEIKIIFPYEDNLSTFDIVLEERNNMDKSQMLLPALLSVAEGYKAYLNGQRMGDTVIDMTVIDERPVMGDDGYLVHKFDDAESRRFAKFNSMRPVNAQAEVSKQRIADRERETKNDGKNNTNK